MKRHVPRINDKLSEIVRDLIYAPSKTELLEVIGKYKSRGMCKSYQNHEKRLPEGAYAEICLEESKRVLFDMKTFKIFVTRDHYTTFSTAEEPEFLKNQGTKPPQNL